jgi:hypothetical protein
MIKKYAIALLFLLSVSVCCKAQSADDGLKQPLKEVLDGIASRFHITVKYDPKLVADKVVTFAGWRIRPADAEKSLNNVLMPLDLMFTKSGSIYSIRTYDYPRWTVEDGKQQLNYLASLYSDAAAWEKRKAEMRSCIFSALKLSPLPSKPASKPIVRPVRDMGEYTIQNIAIETLPGLYCCGSVYRPKNFKDKVPVIMAPNGHFESGRYNKDQQKLCATLAQMGAIVLSYDLFGWGESTLQFKFEDHNQSLAMTIQALNGLRWLDYLLTLNEADAQRVGITGASGGGSQTMLFASLDDRFKVSAPVVMLSCYFYGGSHSESGMPIHLCGGGTDNPEIAAMFAPKPQLVVSDGKDWTAHVPEIEFPYLQRVYHFYNKVDEVSNVHLPLEGHDFGPNKRKAVYQFMAAQFKLNLHKAISTSGQLDERKTTLEKDEAMYVFGTKGERLPANAIKGFDELVKVFNQLSASKY